MFLSMIFPGQGSQHIGMLKQLYTVCPVVKETFDEASYILKYNLWDLIQYGPLMELNKTIKTQPAILTASIAIWRAWKQHGGCDPKFMAGHSLGEYSALVCSGSLIFSDAIKLVETRGMLMQQFSPVGEGAMSVIFGLNETIVTDVCAEEAHDEIVSVANINTFDQIVISGHVKAVQRVNNICKKIGARRVLLLSINVPAHCALMYPVANKFAKVLEMVNFCTPCIPVINNVDVCMEYHPVNIRKALVKHLYSPVRWVDIIKYLACHNVQIILEIGPGHVLTNLTKRIINSLSVMSINDVISLNKAISNYRGKNEF